VLLTFDDGFRNNAEVVAPILRKYRARATFFISSRHTTPGEYLWFIYLRALETRFPHPGFMLRGEFQDLSPKARGATVCRIRDWLLELQPHPIAMYDVLRNEFPPLEEFLSKDQIAEFAGMSTEQLAELSEDRLFTIGAHTVDHPMLSRCSPCEARRQIDENRSWIESVTGKPCAWIAFPGGDYSRETVQIARNADLTGGFAVVPRYDYDSRFELSRVGVYSPTIAHLSAKLKLKRLLTRRPVVDTLSKLKTLTSNYKLT